MIKKVISGGQTGVDQAGLAMASAAGIEIGGWCPKGGLDENGDCILEKHACLQEASTANPDERTVLNIRDSDGTLIIVPSWPVPERIKDGTILTLESVSLQEKPHLVIALDAREDAVTNIRQWIVSNQISVLNIAGPRESNSLGVFQASCGLFQELFAALRPEFKL